jgi:hypothetical protein
MAAVHPRTKTPPGTLSHFHGKPREVPAAIERVKRRKDGKIWEQLECEPDEIFERFCLYRDMGPRRSLAGVAKHIGLSTASGVPGSISKVAADYAWVRRAGEFDEWIDGIKDRALQNEVERHAKVWAKRQLDLREQKFKIAQRMLDLVTARLESDGAIDSLERDLPKFLRAAVAIADATIYEPGDTTGGDDLPNLPAELTEASDDQIHAFIEAAKRRRREQIVFTQTSGTQPPIAFNQTITPQQSSTEIVAQ